jgi:hypothetical protein
MLLRICATQQHALVLSADLTARSAAMLQGIRRCAISTVRS